MMKTLLRFLMSNKGPRITHEFIGKCEQELDAHGILYLLLNTSETVVVYKHVFNDYTVVYEVDGVDIEVTDGAYVASAGVIQQVLYALQAEGRYPTQAWGE